MRNARCISNSQASFCFTVLPLMHHRLAFIAGIIFSYLHQKPTPALDLVITETAALRSEIREARVVVQSLEQNRDSCEWKVWAQGWLLKANLVFDLWVLGWILSRYYWVGPPTAPQPSILADTGGSSSDTDDSSTGQVEQVRRSLEQSGVGKGIPFRTRPLRPSDLKGGKWI